MKKAISTCLAAVLAAASISVPAMADSNSTWQRDKDITALLSELNIMVGDDNGNFNLDANVTRAEMAKIAVASSSYKNTVALGLQFSPFSDVKGTYWGAPYIQAAVSAGIVNGYIDGTFRPNDDVKYEEAVNMMLKVLGYTDDDFGAAYPYGQVGVAESLKMTEGISKQIGQSMTRRDVAKLICNTLDTKSKTTNQDLISVHDCAFVEDVTIVATNADDSTLGTDEIATSSGKYKIDGNFDDSYVGCRGDMVVKNGKHFVAFSSDTETTSNKYVVYSTLNDAIICYADGDNSTMRQFKISDGTTCYKDSVAYTYGSIRQQMEMGDIVRIRYRDDGEVDYISYSEGTLDGPIKVTGSNWESSFDLNAKTKVVRDGKQADKSSIQTNDILYYSDSLNMVMAYTRKVTGVYEDAIPSKDVPNSVVISGVTYEIEGVDAFNDLSSNGSVNIGDTITVLLGSDGKKIAGVATTASTSGTVYAYITGAGKKDFTNADGTTYTSYYVSVVTADGTTYTYPTNYDKSSAVNTVANITIKDGKATVGNGVATGSVSGTVSYTDMKIGTKSVADNVKIIDVAKNPYSDTALYTRTYMQRIDGLDLSKSQVLYCGTNSNGEVDELILQNATGDMYSYGMVTSASKDSTAVIESGSKSYNISGFAGMSVGVPVKFVATGSVADYASSLKTVSGSVSELTQGYAVIDGEKWLVSDSVEVYEQSSGLRFMKMSLTDAIDGDYRYTCYSDRNADEGGRIRVIVARKAD